MPSLSLWVRTLSHFPTLTTSLHPFVYCRPFSCFWWDIHLPEMHFLSFKKVFKTFQFYWRKIDIFTNCIQFRLYNMIFKGVQHDNLICTCIVKWLPQSRQATLRLHVCQVLVTQPRAGQVFVKRELTHLCGREINVHKQWEVLRGKNKQQRYRLDSLGDVKIMAHGFNSFSGPIC